MLAPKGSPVAGATTLAQLADAKIGVQVGTTSLDAVSSSIKPKSSPQVFNDSNDTVRALKGKRVDAIVVDLPTAVDVLRGIPTLLVVYLVGFGVPALELSGLPEDPVVLGGAALALSYSAYVAEVYRAGIQSVHPSQRAAALAVGLTDRQAMRHVVLPQAVRRVVPPLLDDFISLQKDVALVSILGPLEAFIPAPDGARERRPRTCVRARRAAGAGGRPRARAARPLRAGGPVRVAHPPRLGAGLGRCEDVTPGRHALQSRPRHAEQLRIRGYY